MATILSIAFTIFLYFLAVFSIGWRYSKQLRSVRYYFVANRSLGFLPSTASLSATGIGGSATLVATAYIYQFGLAGIWMNLGSAIGLYFLGLLLARKVYSYDVFSLPELVEKLFDKRARLAAAIVILAAEIAWLALTIQAAEAIITAFIPGYPIILSLVATTIFVLYTVLGGQFAITYTDVLQFWLMIAAIVVMVPYSLYLAGGAEGLFASLPGYALQFPASDKFSLSSVITLTLLLGLPHLVGPDIYAKIFSAKDGQTARKASLWSAFIRAGWAAGIAVIGLSALALMPGIKNSNTVLPLFLIQNISPLFSGIVIAALLAILMSSADTILLTSSTIVSHDLLGNIISEQQKISTARSSTVVIGILAFILALYFKSMIQTLELGYALFSGGMILPILFGFFRNRFSFSNEGAFIAMLGGGLYTILVKLQILPGFWSLHAMFHGMGLALLVLILDHIRLFFTPQHTAKER